MIGIAIPLALGGLWLLAAPRRQPRAVAGAILVMALWLGMADRFMFAYHHYLIVHMTAALLLLPRPDSGSRVSQLDCLPITGLAVTLWGWSALAELFVAYFLLRPAHTGAARRVGLCLCVGFGLLAPAFLIAVGVLTWVASHCVACAGRTARRTSSHNPETGQVHTHRLRRLLALAFLALHLALPLRTYLMADHAHTHRGYLWAWRQMADHRQGSVRVQTYDPERMAWRDLTPA